MGLLGDGFEDPRSAAVMALAGGLLQGNFGGGLLGAQQAFRQAKEDAFMHQVKQMQMQNMASEIEQRKAQIAKQQQLQDMVSGLFGVGGKQTSPGAFRTPEDGVGPTMPPQQQPAGIGGMNINQVAGLKALGGPDLMDAFKWANDPLQMQQGSTYRDRITGQERYMPKVGEGMAQGPNGVYGALPGYAMGQAQIEGEKTAANETAKAKLDLVKVFNPVTQREEFRTRAQVAGIQQPGKVDLNAGMDDRRAILQQELQKAVSQGNARDVAALQRELDRMPAGVAAGPSMNDKNAAEAGSDINKSWIKTSYEPTLAGADGARGLQELVQIARQAMRNMGGTGWGTEAKATAANVLAGMGIAPDNAKMFASNSQVFQKAAMERLWNTLNEAKGPQTEGDAARASKTFASLSNTPQANEFILDFAEAKAQRDQIKAKFYQQALPIARDKGDLSEVDREWSRLAPSIFAMPGMQRWGGGIK